MASTQPRTKGRAVPWPYVLSVLLHGAVALALLLMPGQPPTSATRSAPLKVTLVEPPPPKARPATPPPKPASPPAAKPVAPRPARPAAPAKASSPARPAATARPTAPPQATPPPRPTPSAAPADDKITTLRSIPDLAKLSDEELAAIELPPGITSWQDFVKLAQEIGMFKAAFPPPTTGQTGTDVSGGPTWHWETTSTGEQGSIALDIGVVTIVRPTDTLTADVTLTGSDANAQPISFSLPVGPGSDREAIGHAVLERLPQILESARPRPSP